MRERTFVAQRFEGSDAPPQAYSASAAVFAVVVVSSPLTANRE
jgi:hypothetical protein